MKTLSCLILLVSFSITASYAEEKHEKKHEKNHHSGVESLSPKLRGLLQKEMIFLQEGMIAILPAYISGNWEEIEKTSLKMKNSYILKQSITKTQIEELHSFLSPEFIKQDQRFHYLAGMLNHAAKSKKSELIGFYYSKLSESCVSCHSQHATHKFPALSMEKTKDKEHSH